MKTNMKGFTLVEIMIVVAIIGLLIAIALPNFLEARKKSQTRACIANMRNVDGAIQQGMIEEPSLATGWTTSSAIGANYLKNPTSVKCPLATTAQPYSCSPTAQGTNVVCPVNATYTHWL